MIVWQSTITTTPYSAQGAALALSTLSIAGKGTPIDYPSVDDTSMGVHMSLINELSITSNYERNERVYMDAIVVVASSGGNLCPEAM
jgi:hypothetical protein